ncbi:MAG TPA: NADH-ubiquinone oxidoreductase-F iron-sulfur binding region domain-containing protein [Thermodesulfobacteriota bacterium]|nr:NADH-ubiquinone oxidoreductase-F iron-sulfur binding region domain-containing protein [Thermodesulfobacteriota bacterium]
MKLKSDQDLTAFREAILKTKDPKKTCVTICGGTGCRAWGGEEVRSAFIEEIRKQGLEGKADVMRTGCHGFCERGPVVVILPEEIFYQQVVVGDVAEIVSETLLQKRLVQRLLYSDPATGRVITYDHDVPFYKGQMRKVFSDNGRIDPTEIRDYIGRGGYSALGKVLFSMTPEQVIDEVEKSGLRGRGGAGFPTGRKWRLTRRSQGDVKYLVCNADEGDPGAFMDRSVLEGNPHLVLEGMLIAAYSIGSQSGYVYVRAEYPLAVHHLKIAIAQAEEMGLLGDHILGSDFSFHLKIKEGAGAFVCGEETALLASIEGKRGMPRARPPFPAIAGLWGKPTNINNVETYANIRSIILDGSAAYASIGTQGSKGTKIFSLTGKINNTGLVEVPMGTTLRDVIYTIGGGIPRGRRFKAAQMGGPSGGCLPTQYLDLPIDYESLTQAGSMMGSGGMIVMDEKTCMVDIARFFLAFTQDESCGKCVPCRIGTKRMLEILTRITRGEGRDEDIDTLVDMGKTIKDSALCGLGQTCPNPVLSTINHFRHEYEAHIRDRFCPSGACDSLVFAPCENICPVRCDAVGYTALISEGRYDEALRLIRLTMPLAGICGRVCNHPCENMCKRGEIDEPIAISSLKRFASDWEIKLGKMAPPTFLEKPKADRVAVIGAGPAGLNAAYQLGRRGYPVTIFEALPVAGGMLAVGIPDYRLPRKILENDIRFICQHHIEIRTNKALGRDFAIDDLFKQGYKAVFLAMGAHLNQKMNTPGEEAKGVFPGVDFLRRVNLGETIEVGEKVAVIGGGNVAFDAARTALRLGAKEVSIVYRRTRDEMPANDEEIEEAEHERIKLLYLVAPTRIITENGKVKGLECQRMELGDFDASGRRRPVPIKGSDFVMEVNGVIPAIGYIPDLSCLPQNDGFKTTKAGTLSVDSMTLATHLPGVFAGGDLVSGPSTVVEAMASGYRAALSIERYLKGKDLYKDRAYQALERADVPKTEEEEGAVEATKPRATMASMAADRRVCTFEEVNLGFDEETAIREAKRCLRCDLEH